MKKKLLSFIFALGIAFSLNAQVTVSGDITTNTTWTNNNIYMLTGGFVYVTNNATLTIQPGTLIKGNASSLVITRGSKIIADGTQTQPIVFTSYQPAGSRAAADWGGVLLLGKAPINDPAGERLAEGGIDPVKGKYGGTDPNDNSGIMRYCRIEYAGIAYLPNNETNGLTMGAVGLGTTIDYIQVSYGGDDSFEWFGGTVNCKHLIGRANIDDIFDTDYGYSGNLQFLLGFSDSLVADVSKSNGFESDNDGSGSTNPPLTHAIFSNVTIIGPKITSSTNINANYGAPLHIRRSSTLCTYNSVFTGFPNKMKIEGTNTGANVNNKSLQFKNNIIAGCPMVIDSSGMSTTGTGSPAWTTWNGWFTAYSNSFLPNSTDIMAVNPYNYSNPNFLLQGGSPAITGADFSSPNLNNSFFTTTAYRGAFDGTNDWTKCWTNWDPQNTPYTTGPINYLAVSSSANGATTFCQGGSVTLTATSASAISYLWSNGATTSAITVNTSGTFGCTVMNSGGCSATSNAITVTVNSLPSVSVTAGGSTTFCQGGSVMLTSSASSSYQWSTGASASSITASTAGNYNVTITDGNGCTNTSSNTVVTVNALPTASVAASGPTVFCTGGSVILSENSSASYLWSNGATASSITVTSSGAYYVTITNANGCTSAPSNPISVSVSNSPPPTVTVTGSTSLCQGEMVTLCSSNSDTYSWSTGATTQCVAVSSSGNYNVTVTNSNACNGVGTSSNTNVTVNSLPSASFTSAGTVPSISFTNTSTGGTTYLWDFGDGSFSTLQSPTHVYGSNGIYTACLIVTNASGCDDSTCHAVNINTGINEIENISTINLYPNPVNNQATLEFNLGDNAEVSIMMIDMTGKVVFSVKDKFSAGNNQVKIDANEMQNGVYFTRIITNNASKTVKTVVLK